MTMLGKRIRLQRLIRPKSNSAVICALDHGMTSPSFLEGLFETRERARQAIAGGANVFMLGRGMAQKAAQDFTPETSLALMLTASAAGRPDGPVITPISSVREALRLGADAVVVYVALAGDSEPDMISYLSQVGEACMAEGMPLIAEAEYPSAYQTLDQSEGHYGYDYLIRNVRLCAEMGADIVKVNWPGSQELLGNIVRSTQGVPVVVAGGTLISDQELLTRMEQAMAVGAIGCSVGRNIFQHDRPEAITRALARVIHERWTAAEALEELEHT